jgi:hypothetical protein
LEVRPVTRKNDASTYTDKRGKFAKGNPGRPAGARHEVTRAVEALLEGEVEALTRKAIEKALEGDMIALRLCLDRIAPARKDSPIVVKVPVLKTAKDAGKAAAQIIASVSEGKLTPIEGASVMALVDSYRRTLEITEIEERISAIEEVSNGNH